ncbi:MAG: hypothetical protein ACXVP1_06085 [Thermoleophilia bacterium]
MPATLFLSIFLSLAAYTAANTITSAGAVDQLAQAISIDDVTPAVCKGHNIHPGAIRYHDGTGWHTGRGNGNSQLWLGYATPAETISAGNSADCLVPGAVPAGQHDTETGGSGSDDCLNGPGPGTYTRTCEFTDSYPYTS